MQIIIVSYIWGILNSMSVKIEFSNVLLWLLLIAVLLYVVISAVRSGKQGIALYKHIIVRISIFSVPIMLTSAILTCSGLSMNEIFGTTTPPSDDLSKLLYLFFVIPTMGVVGMLNIIVWVVHILLFGGLVAILWIIYAIAKHRTKVKLIKSMKDTPSSEYVTVEAQEIKINTEDSYDNT